MTARRFDAIVIGTGQAGPSLARQMAGEGRTVAVIERHRVGGTCVNTGCIPTKTLVASARVAHVARRAADYGVLAGPVRVDMGRVKARMREVAGLSESAVTRGLEQTDGIELIRGHARFEDAHVVRVNDDRLTAPLVFINVGGRAAVPPIEGLDGVPFLTNSSLLDHDELPEHLIVVGGSYIGLEFGQMYRRFGSEVTVLQRDARIVPREDEDVSAALQEILEGEGIAVRTGAECIAVERRGNRIVARAPCAGREDAIDGTHLLIATGRVPNTDDLGLDRAGIEVDRRGYIQVDDRLRTHVDGVYALGDCNGRGAFTHTSYNDYEIVAANLLEGGDRRVTDRIPAYALYTDPPLGRAGWNERDARASGRRVLAGRVEMENVGRATERGETQGFMKVLVDGDSEEILGVSLLGIEADEVVHTFINLMAAKAPWTVIARTMHIHPTVSEYLPSLFLSLEPLAAASGRAGGGG